MSFTDKWIIHRKYKKSRKKSQSSLLLSQYSNSKEYIKLHDLSELYLDCFDLMTKVGIEISKIADDTNS